MTQQTITQKQDKNAIIYVDYENTAERLRNYGVSPIEINFFPVVLDKYMESFNILECIAYANFGRSPISFHQSHLQNYGILTRHSSNSGKNCSDLMMTVDLMTSLHKNPNIEVFIVISSDRDMIPLLKAIKHENKIVCMLTTKIHSNSSVSFYAHQYEYIEDLFNLSPEMLIVNDLELDPAFDQNLNPVEIDKAKEICVLLYSSKIWGKYEEKGIPVKLTSYAETVSAVVRREPDRIVDEFRLAHRLKLVTIYKTPVFSYLCLKEGENSKLLKGAKILT